MAAEFTFAIQWQQRDPGGLMRDYTQQFTADDLYDARRMHNHSLEGLWVKTETLRPHVSALRVRKWGRLLEEELAPARDLPEHGRSSPPPLGPDPRIDPRVRETLGLILRAGKDAA